MEDVADRDRLDGNDVDVDDEGEEFVRGITGAPDGWTPPAAPDTFEGYQPKNGAPLSFEEVDNPGGWSQYTFQPTYNKNNPKSYAGHESPTGAKVLPVDTATGKREKNGWHFHYSGWTPDDFDKGTYVRGDAKWGDMKPKDRKGRLDVLALKKHGMTKVRTKDPFFFLQLLLPIHDPKMAGKGAQGIDIDGRIPYPHFTHCLANTAIYASAVKGWGGSYGHAATAQVPNETKLVRWHGAPILHGALDGKPGTLHRRWLRKDKMYDPDVAESMYYWRWRQIKSVFKLNNNMVSPKKGQEGYDPCHRYDHIFKCVCHNM